MRLLRGGGYRVVACRAQGEECDEDSEFDESVATFTAAGVVGFTATPAQPIAGEDITWTLALVGGAGANRMRVVGPVAPGWTCEQTGASQNSAALRGGSLRKLEAGAGSPRQRNFGV